MLPAHNEADLLERPSTRWSKACAPGACSFEVIIVENGSTDDTAAIARRLEAGIPELRAYSLGEPNYGRALRAGLLAAGGDVVVNFDVDLCDLGFLDRAVPMVAAPDGPGRGGRVEADRRVPTTPVARPPVRHRRASRPSSDSASGCRCRTPTA